MILYIDTPRNYNIIDVLKKYHIFCIDMIDKYGLDYLVGSNTIVVVGKWDYQIYKNIDNNLLVVNWDKHRFPFRENLAHDPFYCTFNTLYKFSLWYKYITKYDDLNSGSYLNDLRRNWFTHFSFHSGINIRNISDEK